MQIVKGKHYDNPMFSRKSRLPSGHAEGWYYAFADIYAGFLAALDGDTAAYYPSIDDGAAGDMTDRHCRSLRRTGEILVWDLV